MATAPRARARDKVEQELLKVQSRNREGKLVPAEVVEYARNPRTALHKRFTWDDTEAAHQYRLYQARQIIRITMTLIEEEREDFRAYVSLYEDRQDPGGGYRLTVNVLSDPDGRARLLAQAKREFDAWRRKYRDLTELAAVFAARDDLDMPGAARG